VRLFVVKSFDRTFVVCWWSVTQGSVELVWYLLNRRTRPWMTFALEERRILTVLGRFLRRSSEARKSFLDDFVLIAFYIEGLRILTPFSELQVNEPRGFVDRTTPFPLSYFPIPLHCVTLSQE